MRYNKKIKGFILLETMLAITILGTILVVSIQSFSLFARTASAASNMNDAAFKGQEILSKIRHYEFDFGKSEGMFDEKYRWRVLKSEITDTKVMYDYFVIWKNKEIRFVTYKHEKTS